jgi:hypothetical protein
MTDAAHSSKGEAHAQIVFRVEAQRIYMAYVWHVLPVLFTISNLSWVVFTVSPQQIYERGVIVTTTFLTLVAYKFSIDEQLPEVHYLTVVHKYILMTMVYLLLVTVEITSFYVLGAADCHLNPTLFLEVGHTPSFKLFV